jgi:hypothetical protein
MMLVGPGPPLLFCPHAVRRSEPSADVTSAPLGNLTVWSAGIGVAATTSVEPCLPSEYNPVMTNEYSCPPWSEPSVQLGVVISPECATQHAGSSVRLLSTVYPRVPLTEFHETVTEVGLVGTAVALYGAGPAVVVGPETVAIGVRICAFNVDPAITTTIGKA